MATTKVTFSMVAGAPGNVLDYGAVGDGVTNDTVAVSTAITESKTVYFPPGTYLVDSINVPSDVTLQFSSGAMLSPSTSNTVTINGLINANIEQIFVVDGDVLFGDKIATIYPQWFGASESATPADNKSAIDYAIATGKIVSLAGAVLQTTGLAPATIVYLLDGTLDNTSTDETLITLLADSKLRLENVTILSSGQSSGWAISAQPSTCRYPYIRNCKITGHFNGIDIWDGLDGTIDALYLSGQANGDGIGLKLGDVGAGVGGTTWTIKDVYFTQWEYGLYNDGSEGSLVIRPIFESSTYGMRSDTRGTVLEPYCAAITGTEFVLGSAARAQGLLILGYGSSTNNVSYSEDATRQRTTILPDGGGGWGQLFGRGQYYGVSAPVSGTYNKGDIVWNNEPTSPGYIGWVCWIAGTPGTWKTFGPIT